MLKFGFLGFGQGGGRLVDAILPLSDQYVGMAVNTAINDLEALQHIPDGYRMQLQGNSFGAGRTPELGLQAFLENGPEFLELAQTVTKDTDFIWAVAGLGGGTGTGVMQGFLEHGTQLFDQPVGLIVTMPRDDDGAIQKANVLSVMNQMQKAIDEKRIGAVIVVDNDRFYRQFAEEKRPGDWRDHSNAILANTLHRLNGITGASGQSNFDRTDLLKLLCSSGCLAIGSAALHDYDMEGAYRTVRNAIQKGFFSTGYRLEEAEYYALCFSLNDQGTQLRSSTYEQYFSHHFRSLFPRAIDSFFGYYTEEQNNVLSVVSGLGFPERVFLFRDQVNVIEERQTKRFEVSSLPEIAATNPLLKNKSTVSADNPLLKKRNPLIDSPSPNSNPLLKKK